MKEQLRELTDEETKALQVFANKTGRCWKAELSKLWLNGAIGMPLYGLRNTHGPDWLNKFELPPSPPAKNLYEFVEKYGLFGAIQREGRGWKTLVRNPHNDKTVSLYHPGIGTSWGPKLANFIRVALNSKDLGVLKGLKKFLGSRYDEATQCSDSGLKETR